MLMSAKDGRTLLSSGGPLIGFFALPTVLFTQEGRWLVSCGAEPSLLSDLLIVSSRKSVVGWGVLRSLSSDLLVESSEVLIILDPNQCIKKKQLKLMIIYKMENILIFTKSVIVIFARPDWLQ